MNPEKQSSSNVPEGENRKTHEEAYRFLTNLPEGLEASDVRLKDLAKKYNETICIKTAPEQTEKGWVLRNQYGNQK